MTRPTLPQTAGRWARVARRRPTTPARPTGHLEVFWAPALGRWVSVPDVSRYVVIEPA